ncbi:hypothetical protein PoB_007473900 [Plakobranchus ocellatus]|uniref:Uncharacterized protein n=1 Tax=Plakobranchus ocellatus TaxID=259542 RepID=A0AAV4DVI3_9GAST|nr:hypothetical protein PoB_007473900 [Plakobranchus ocellatus]
MSKVPHLDGVINWARDSGHVESGSPERRIGFAIRQKARRGQSPSPTDPDRRGVQQDFTSQQQARPGMQGTPQPVQTIVISLQQTTWRDLQTHRTCPCPEAVRSIPASLDNTLSQRST